MTKAESYLEALLKSRYDDSTDRSKERVFSGEDIKNAFNGGYNMGVNKCIEELSTIKNKE